MARPKRGKGPALEYPQDQEGPPRQLPGTPGASMAPRADGKGLLWSTWLRTHSSGCGADSERWLPRRDILRSHPLTPTGPGSFPAPQCVPPPPGPTPAASSCQPPGGVQGRGHHHPGTSGVSFLPPLKTTEASNVPVPVQPEAPSEGHQAARAIPGGRDRCCV